MASNYDRHCVPFDDLPDRRRVWNEPRGSHKEGLGRLILLTPDVVATAASSCIRSGRRVCLNWNMQKLEHAKFNRQPPQHHIVALLDEFAFDDTYIFNPQQSSQWDGLRHHSWPDASPDNPSSRTFYGGTKAAEIHDRSNTRIGIQHRAREGICGRGVLLDYARYAEKHGIEYSTFSTHAVPLSVLQDVAREEGVSFKRGDILFIRIGVTKEWDTMMTIKDKLDYVQKPTQHAGIEATEEMLRWIWKEGFVTLASDSISLEVFPDQDEYPRPDGQPAVPGLSLHAYLIAGWGMPIGEPFDLEALSEICRQENRREFFVSSSPLNMPGGVSSPPNCMAIF